MDQFELDALLVRHIADLDDGVRRLTQIERAVGDEIDSLAAKWGGDNDWVVDQGWNDASCSVMPRAWRRGEDDWPAYFTLDYGSGDPGAQQPGGDYFWLTRLCNAGSGKFGFRFVQDEFGKREWRKFISERTDVMVDTKFILDDDPSFFLPFCVQAEALSAAVENDDIKGALGPMKEALDHIAEHVAKFEALLTAMRARTGQK